MCSVVGTRRAELDCSVLEEDWQRGQSYTAHWYSMALLPQQHHRLTELEAERLAKHCEARRLLQRFLSGAINKDPPHPKTQISTAQPNPGHFQERVCCVSMSLKSNALETSDRKPVVNITKLPRFLG